MTQIPTRWRILAAGPARRGFTLVELLVVVVVIGVVMSLLLLVGARVVDHQKRTTTQNTMRLTEMAIEQFKTTDPLQDMYDNPKLREPSLTPPMVGRTFGPYPPYQLANATAGTVADYLERSAYASAEGVDQSLGARLTRELSQQKPLPAEPNAWVDVEQGNNNDDIRSLYCYLAAFTPGVLSQIPDSAKKPLADRKGTPTERINPTGAGTNPPGDGAIDVFGIYDAWGVPLDYFLQVRIEAFWNDNLSPPGLDWRVADRVPVLRSRGVALEKAQAADKALSSADETLVNDEASHWIFSQAFPQPAAKCVAVTAPDGAKSGTITTSATAANDGGWVRVRAGGKPTDQTTWDSYYYVPYEGR